jgi:molybdate transport system substrate-binding protein
LLSIVKNNARGIKKWIASSLTAAVIVLPLAAPAADLTVLTAGAYKQVVTAMAPQFEASTGHRIILENDTAGGVANAVRSRASIAKRIAPYV